MLISTDDGRFGLVLTQVGGGGMFRFQIIVGGRLIGDVDPCLPGSALRQLGQLKALDDTRLGHLSENPAEIAALLRSDEGLHDGSVLALAESMDRWLVYGYVYGGNVHFLAQEYRNRQLDEATLTSTIDFGEYDLIIDAVLHYWLRVGGGAWVTAGRSA
jgi:hypothetical protein